ncbi:MAG: hypothetical protein A3H28_11955 [Acidobacteria bacterium RIFCSPLOWO2_02_FULL_61_28]|nr:MAG: hypothetical protein A3H28_11955 [Acidobacteria bacterium RIFCSPLOWO2_02_FULL_61_28]
MGQNRQVGVVALGLVILMALVGIVISGTYGKVSQFWIEMQAKIGVVGFPENVLIYDTPIYIKNLTSANNIIYLILRCCGGNYASANRDVSARKQYRYTTSWNRHSIGWSERLLPSDNFEINLHSHVPSYTFPRVRNLHGEVWPFSNLQIHTFPAVSKFRLNGKRRSEPSALIQAGLGNSSIQRSRAGIGLIFGSIGGFLHRRALFPHFSQDVFGRFIAGFQGISGDPGSTSGSIGALLRSLGSFAQGRPLIIRDDGISDDGEECKNFNGKSPLFEAMGLCLLGFIALYYGGWNIKFNSRIWLGVGAITLGFTFFWHGFASLLIWSVRQES